MNHKIIVYVFIAIAIIAGVLSLINQNTFVIAAVTSRFFEIMLPIVGFAAICKFLLCCGEKHCSNDK